MSKKSILLTVVVVIVAIVAIGAIVVDNKYRAVLSSPRIAFDSKFVDPQTRLQFVINPELARKFVEENFLKEQSIPGWVLPLALPYQAAVVLNMDYALSNLDITAYINDKRLAPIILQKINSAKIPAPFDQWLPKGMESKQRGMLVRQGGGRLDRAVINQVRTLWKNATVAEPLKVDGTHLAELLLDNRDGGTVALALAVAGLMYPNGQDGFKLDNLPSGPLGAMTTIGFIRLTADIADDQSLKVHMTVDCSQLGDTDNDKAMVQMVGMFMDTAYLQISSLLAPKKLTIQSQMASVKGKTVEGDYTIPNINQVIKQYM